MITNLCQVFIQLLNLPPLQLLANRCAMGWWEEQRGHHQLYNGTHQTPCSHIFNLFINLHICSVVQHLEVHMFTFLIARHYFVHVCYPLNQHKRNPSNLQQISCFCCLLAALKIQGLVWWQYHCDLVASVVLDMWCQHFNSHWTMQIVGNLGLVTVSQPDLPHGML